MKKRNKIRKNFSLFLLVLFIISTNILYSPKGEKYHTNEKEDSQENLSNELITDNVGSVSHLEINAQTENFNINNKDYEIEPHIDEETGVKYFTYEDFGVYADGIHDDYEAIKIAHYIANQKGFEIWAQKREYHIFKEDDINPIEIKTNTNWNGATIVIHDENIKDLKVKDYPVFRIVSPMSKIVIENQDILNNIKIDVNTKSIPQLSGYGNCLCVIFNSDKKQFIRSGSNKNSGNQQQDILKIDNNGNILEEVQWNFNNITSISLIPIPDETLVVQNATFKTILPLDGYEQDQGYLARNLVCYRGNCEIKNINHELNNNDEIGGPYYGFLQLEWVCDVKLQNCKLVSHKYKKTSNYDLIIEYSSNIELENVISDDIEDSSRWGIVGTNYTKDIIYKNCKLNRIDAHCGVYNLKIENCEIGIHGITVVGSGELTITNTTSYSNNSLVYLRADYGSTWNGTINIKNCVLKKAKTPQIIDFCVTYNDGKLHDYGYPLYLPNVNIDGLTWEDELVSLENEKLYIFNNIQSKTGVSNGDIRNNYILPQNIMINDYKTTSGRKLQLFYNKFYNSLQELGINLSIPLSDKQKVQITDDNNEELISNTITRQNVKINKIETEGIETNININQEKKTEQEILLNQEGTYNIEITYKNIEGKVETENARITIDKTSPTISNVEQGQIYIQNVTPQVTDSNLEKVELILNGQVVQNYKVNSAIIEEGLYQLIAMDKAGNERTVSFELFKNQNKTYEIEKDIIKNVQGETKQFDFKAKLNLKIEYEISRNTEKLTDETIIATGDILKTKAGQTYTLIVAGDLDKDGKVSIKDIVKLRKYLLIKNGLDPIEKLAADTNLDEKEISIKDLVRMRILALKRK